VGVTGWARASLAANIGIVVTGGLVRLTDSGLGCPRWPKCTDDRWTTHAALGIHGAIEFGNRLLTYVLVAIAIGTLVSVWRWADSNRSVRRLAIALAAGIPLQGVIGGITVLTDLNPWLVSLHLVLSMVLITGSAILIDKVSDRDRAAVSTAARVLVAVIAVLAAGVVYLGTIVTGSGPHAGDSAAPRNGLDPLTFSHVHAAAAYALVAATLLAVWALRGTTVQRAAWALLGVELLQAGVGVAQYNLGLPIVLVAAHLFGAALLVAATATLAVRAFVSRGTDRPQPQRTTAQGTRSTGGTAASA
jgi:cytochrome c oxidase assembly protein subunit 15